MPARQFASQVKRETSEEVDQAFQKKYCLPDSGAEISCVDGSREVDLLA